MTTAAPQTPLSLRECIEGIKYGNCMIVYPLILPFSRKEKERIVLQLRVFSMSGVYQLLAGMRLINSWLLSQSFLIGQQ